MPELKSNAILILGICTECAFLLTTHPDSMEATQ